MHIAYPSVYDSNNPRNWSGTGWYIGWSLEQQGNKLSRIGPLAERPSLAARIKGRIYARRGMEYEMGRSPSVARGYAAQVAEQLRTIKPDVIVAPGIQPLAYLKTDRPMVFWSDCTFAGMLGFYPDYANLSPATIREGNALEQLALDRCDLAFFTTNWAADSARQHYRVDEKKIRVVPLGANIPTWPTDHEIEARLAARLAKPPIRLLFIGQRWARKRGDLAVEVARLLNERGLTTELCLAGSDPPDPAALPSYVTRHGFLDKSTEAGKRQFDNLLGQAHFLIVPSQAEAYGLVYCEAAAHGVPSLATAVGGVPDIVREGETGRAFPLSAGAEAYADYVQSLFATPGAYHALARSARRTFLERLNWDSAGRLAMSHLRELV